jgi:hypothetical protein
MDLASSGVSLACLFSAELHAVKSIARAKSMNATRRLIFSNFFIIFFFIKEN